MLAPEAGEKLAKVIALSAAVERARAALDASPPHEKAAAALSLQQLQNQRRELMGLLPKLRVVGGTEA